MTTDPIAAARAMIEPLTGYTPKPWWTSGKYSGREMGCSIIAANPSAGPAPGNPTRGGVAFATAILNTDARRCEANARLIVAAPDLRDMVATLADALEAERAERERAESAETEYRRKNHRLMVEMEQAHAAAAAAYEAAALFSESQRREGDSFYNDGWCACATVVAGGIRNITPADAQAALDKLLADARLEGWRAGRDAAANEAALYGCSEGADEYTEGIHVGYTDAVGQIVDGIRALPEPKEASYG